MDRLLLCFVIYLLHDAVAVSKDESKEEYHQGRFTRDIPKSKSNLIYPRKVDHTGEFVSHLIPHHYKRSYYYAKEDSFGPEDHVHYRIPIDGEDHHLELQPNHGLMSPGMVVETRGDNVQIRRGKDTQCHYRGTVRGHNASSTAVSTCYGLAGFVRTKRGYYIIEPIRDHDHTTGKEHAHVLYKLDPDEILEPNCRTKGGMVHAMAERALREGKRTPLQTAATSAKDVNVNMYVETLVVLDKPFLDYHKKYDVENYALTVMNMVYNMYEDASLSAQLDVAVVRIIRLEKEKDEMNLKVNKDAMTTLTNFCDWQKKMNPGDDSHPNHHDVAVLLTRVDICYDNTECGLLGLAKIAGTCDPKISCAINEDNGLILGYTVGHEMGHTLGMDHDTPQISGCSGFMGSDKKWQTVMNPTITSYTGDWSTCSQAYFKAFISAGFAKCLMDKPSDHDFKIVNILPGVMYGAEYQCKELFTKDAYVCEMGFTCESLNCKTPKSKCFESHEPPVAGTPCGEKKWCYQRKCITMGQRPNAVNGGWGGWGPWSKCSRTCGAGVTSTERQCDKPKPAHGGKYCVGERKRHKICATEPCDVDKPSFRDVQCSEFNNWVYPETKKKHKWKGIFLRGENPCSLACLNEADTVATLKPQVVDGTTCHRGLRDICIGGACRAIPCDLDMESKAVEDVCGVCHGDGKGCTISRGEMSFKKNLKKLEKLVDIPEGARNIRVQEVEPSAGHIVVREGKNIMVNGDKLGMFQVPGSKAWLGMIHQNQEALNIPGPVSKKLTVSLRVLEDMKLEYSMALKKAKRRREDTPSYTWDWVDWSDCSTQCGPGLQISVPRCVEKVGGLVEDTYCKDVEKPDDQEKPCYLEPCAPRWMIGDWSAECEGGKRTREVKCVKPAGEGEGESDIIDDSECQGAKPECEEACKGNDTCSLTSRQTDYDPQHVPLIPLDRVDENRDAGLAAWTFDDDSNTSVDKGKSKKKRSAPVESSAEKKKLDNLKENLKKLDFLFAPDVLNRQRAMQEGNSKNVRSSVKNPTAKKEIATVKPVKKDIKAKRSVELRNLGHQGSEYLDNEVNVREYEEASKMDLKNGDSGYLGPSNEATLESDEGSNELKVASGVEQQFTPSNSRKLLRRSAAYLDEDLTEYEEGPKTIDKTSNVGEKSVDKKRQSKGVDAQEIDTKADPLNNVDPILRADESKLHKRSLLTQPFVFTEDVTKVKEPSKNSKISTKEYLFSKYNLGCDKKPHDQGLNAHNDAFETALNDNGMNEHPLSLLDLEMERELNEKLMDPSVSATSTHSIRSSQSLMEPLRLRDPIGLVRRKRKAIDAKQVRTFPSAQFYDVDTMPVASVDETGKLLEESNEFNGITDENEELENSETLTPGRRKKRQNRLELRSLSSRQELQASPEGDPIMSRKLELMIPIEVDLVDTSTQDKSMHQRNTKHPTNSPSEKVYDNAVYNQFTKESLRPKYFGRNSWKETNSKNAISSQKENFYAAKPNQILTNIAEPVKDDGYSGSNANDLPLSIGDTNQSQEDELYDNSYLDQNESGALADEQKDALMESYNQKRDYGSAEPGVNEPSPVTFVETRDIQAAPLPGESPLPSSLLSVMDMSKILTQHLPTVLEARKQQRPLAGRFKFGIEDAQPSRQAPRGGRYVLGSERVYTGFEPNRRIADLEAGVKPWLKQRVVKRLAGNRDSLEAGAAYRDKNEGHATLVEAPDAYKEEETNHASLEAGAAYRDKNEGLASLGEAPDAYEEEETNHASLETGVAYRDKNEGHATLVEAPDAYNQVETNHASLEAGAAYRDKNEGDASSLVEAPDAYTEEETNHASLEAGDAYRDKNEGLASLEAGAAYRDKNEGLASLETGAAYRDQNEGLASLVEAPDAYKEEETNHASLEAGDAYRDKNEGLASLEAGAAYRDKNEGLASLETGAAYRDKNEGLASLETGAAYTNQNEGLASQETGAAYRDQNEGLASLETGAAYRDKNEGHASLVEAPDAYKKEEMDHASPEAGAAYRDKNEGDASLVEAPDAYEEEETNHASLEAGAAYRDQNEGHASLEAGAAYRDKNEGHASLEAGAAYRDQNEGLASLEAGDAYRDKNEGLASLETGAAYRDKNEGHASLEAGAAYRDKNEGLASLEEEPDAYKEEETNHASLDAGAAYRDKNEGLASLEEAPDAYKEEETNHASLEAGTAYRNKNEGLASLEAGAAYRDKNEGLASLGEAPDAYEEEKTNHAKLEACTAYRDKNEGLASLEAGAAYRDKNEGHASLVEAPDAYNGEETNHASLEAGAAYRDKNEGLASLEAGAAYRDKNEGLASLEAGAAYRDKNEGPASLVEAPDAYKGEETNHASLEAGAAYRDKNEGLASLEAGAAYRDKNEGHASLEAGAAYRDKIEGHASLVEAPDAYKGEETNHASLEAGAAYSDKNEGDASLVEAPDAYEEKETNHASLETGAAYRDQNEGLSSLETGAAYRDKNEGPASLLEEPDAYEEDETIHASLEAPDSYRDKNDGHASVEEFDAFMEDNAGYAPLEEGPDAFRENEKTHISRGSAEAYKDVNAGYASVEETPDAYKENDKAHISRGSPEAYKDVNAGYASVEETPDAYKENDKAHISRGSPEAYKDVNAGYASAEEGPDANKEDMRNVHKKRLSDDGDKEACSNHSLQHGEGQPRKLQRGETVVDKEDPDQLHFSVFNEDEDKDNPTENHSPTKIDGKEVLDTIEKMQEETQNQTQSPGND